MKTIQTLVPDIQALLKTKGWFDAYEADCGREVARRLSEQFSTASYAPSLRLSQMGPRCPKALWGSIHCSHEAEQLPPWAEFKFAFGHIIEATAIVMAKATGHEVTGEQDELYVDGIRGHRDCVIDGCIVDVKSCSSRSFQNFKSGAIAHNDTFGYLDQLDGYLVGSADDDLVRVKDKGYLLAIDKQLGHMCVYEHQCRRESILERVKRYKEIVARDEPPHCECGTNHDGKSGNIKLDVKASYSAQKYFCNPSIRTFLYASGPVYLTNVVRKPDVPEVDRWGKIVYN